MVLCGWGGRCEWCVERVEVAGRVEPVVQGVRGVVRVESAVRVVRAVRAVSEVRAVQGVRVEPASAPSP